MYKDKGRVHLELGIRLESPEKVRKWRNLTFETKSLATQLQLRVSRDPRWRREERRESCKNAFFVINKYTMLFVIYG